MNDFSTDKKPPQNGRRKLVLPRRRPVGDGGDDRQYRIDYRSELNEEQYRAVTALNGPVLVVAGAGSGKTRVITYRVAYTMENGAPPERIVLLTFTRRAAKEMLNRAQNLSGLECSRVNGGTFHSFANLQLRRYGKHIGLDSNFVVLDQGDSEDAVKLIRDQLRLGETGRRFPNKRTVFSILSKARNKVMPVDDVVMEEFPHFEEEIPDLKRISEEYGKLKRERMLVDFDDLLEFYRDLLRSPFGETLCQRYLYIMADEYQDTNRVQAEIVQLLGQGHNNVCVVGDDAQCIYTWRGSDFENIMRFERDFPGAQVIKLERNYRSIQPILDLANQVMTKAAHSYTKVLRATRGAGEMPAFFTAEDPNEQATMIAERILQLREQGTPLQEIAVLARAIWHLREIELELTRRNIPYVVYGGIRFSEAAHIKDVLAYLRLAVNPKDDLSLKRVLELLPKVGARTSERIINAVADSDDPWTTLAEPDVKVNAKIKEHLAGMSSLLSSLSQDKIRPSECVELAAKYYKPILESRFDDYPRRQSDLEQLATLAAPYRSLQSLLTDMTLEPNRDRSQQRIVTVDPDDEHLVLSTVHSAKGLEFQVVFIPHLLDGVFPGVRSFDFPEALEEERRLLYVAITRAKDDLYLSAPLYMPGRSWMTWDRGMGAISRFLDKDTSAYFHPLEVDWI